jgi:hypothetical protein
MAYKPEICKEKEYGWNVCSTSNDNAVIVYGDYYRLDDDALQIYFKGEPTRRLQFLRGCDKLVRLDEGYIGCYDDPVRRNTTIRKFKSIDGEAEWSVEWSVELDDRVSSITVCRGNVICVLDHDMNLLCVNIKTGLRSVQRVNTTARIQSIACNPLTNDIVADIYDEFEQIVLLDGTTFEIQRRLTVDPGHEFHCDGSGRLYMLNGRTTKINIFDIETDTHLRSVRLLGEAQSFDLNSTDELVVLFENEVCLYGAIFPETKSARWM